MKRLFLLGGLGGMLALFPVAVGGAAVEVSVRAKPAEFRIQGAKKELPVGEHLRYQVNWLGIPIGSGDLRVESVSDGDAGSAWLMAEARSNDFLSMICRVEDKMRTRVASDGSYALRYEKNLREGGYRAHEKVDFDYGKNMGFYESFTNGSRKEIELEGPTHDILSAFYWFRMQDVQPGDTIEARVNADEKNWDLLVRVLRTERLELRNLGTFETFVVEPVGRFKGVFVKRGRAWIHFSADARRIPLKIKMNTPLGPVVAVLESIPGGEDT